MNSCEYYQELISSLVDGEISQEENEALMLHLNSCSRCNAMYAVFHDLSDILSEDPEPLPEGLHENIMAGIRRSEIMKKNRRMRRIGLRTAMTAAACAVLVLFAAVGFTPGERAESVSIRSEQEAVQQLPPSPAPALYTPDTVPVPVPVTAAPASYPTPAPVQTPYPVQDPAPVQIPVQTSTPVQTAAPADPFFVSSGSMDTQYNAPQQSNFYTNDQPAQVYTPAPAVIPTTPMPSQTVAPAPAVSTPAPAQTAAPAYDRVSAPTPTPAVSEAQPVLTAAPMLSMTAPAAPAASEAQSAPAALPAVEQAAPAAAPVVETEAPAEESGMLSFSLFSEIGSLLSSGPDALTESKLTSQEQTLLSAAPPDSLAEDAPPLTVEDGTETAVPEAPTLFSLFSAPALGAGEAAPAEDAAEEPAAAKPEEEKLSIYDKTLRAQLLAMLGSSEDSLPEAELTRLVHVKLTPPDEYASEEQVDICIYGDFIFYRRTASDGVVRTYRADCSLRDLDSFLQSCKTAAATPTPAPTLDPYMAAPAPTPEPSPEASAEASPEPTAP